MGGGSRVPSPAPTVRKGLGTIFGSFHRYTIAGCVNMMKGYEREGATHISFDAHSTS